MSFSIISRYWHTLKYLKFSQFYRRFWYKFFRPKILSFSNISLRTQSIEFVEPILKTQSMKSETAFNFINETGDINNIGWIGNTMSLLWRYNLHYFDDLNAVDYIQRKNWHTNIINDWCENNQPGSKIAWDSYPTSLRIVNWCKFYLSGRECSKAMIDSLCSQADWLNKRIEYHLLGNHVLANAKALYFAGSIFKGKNSQKWLSNGKKILNQQFKEQILSDGGHFELSPMYHSIILEDILDLINISRVYGFDDDANEWIPYVKKMIRWQKSMCHPDGQLSFFNDTAFGIAASISDIEKYVDRLNLEYDKKKFEESTYFQSSGYIRLTKNTASLLCDVGRIGPDYIPGHAHADCLSFELSVFSNRVFVNSGISTYEDGPERAHQRSTMAHNTVVINSKNSSDVWSSFRVGKRAKPINCKVDFKQDFQKVICSHDGYYQKNNKLTHERCWELSDNFLKITDKIKGIKKSAEAFFYCHPDIIIKENEDFNHLKLVLKNGNILNLFVEGAKVSIEDALWHPEFGVSIPNKRIRLVIGTKCTTIINF